MLKRKPETQYDRNGVPEKADEEPEDKNISTPEEIKNRKIYRIIRPSAVKRTGFILKSKLVSEATEAQLLCDSKISTVDFFSVSEAEVKEASPGKNLSGPAVFEKPKEKQPESSVSAKQAEKTLSKSSIPASSVQKYSNPLAFLLNNIQSKKEEDVVSSFISSTALKTEPVFVKTEFSGTPQKSVLESIISLEAEISVDGVLRGPGFVEIAKGTISGSKICTIIFKNQIRSIIYQASLSKFSEPKLCKDWKIGEYDGTNVEVEISVYRKSEKITKENLRILAKKTDSNAFIAALEKAKNFL